MITPTKLIMTNGIGGVMASVLATSDVDHWFDPQLGQIEDCKIGIGFFSAKHAVLMSKNKDWLAQRLFQ
jgi:hypothetical protein